MSITIHKEIEQGTDEWLAARCGVLTASEMKLIITPAKMAFATNDKCRAHVYEIAAQRITKYVEPCYMSADMERGHMDEIEARFIYRKNHAEVTEVGFITNDEHGFTLGYSPDGLVGDDGLIEIKSRKQKYQLQTIATGEIPTEYLLQLQTGLLVSGREWIDFISYSGGMHLYVQRVHADNAIQNAILEAAEAFEEAVADYINKYEENAQGLYLTERLIMEEEIMV